MVSNQIKSNLLKQQMCMHEHHSNYTSSGVTRNSGGPGQISKPSLPLPYLPFFLAPCGAGAPLFPLVHLLFHLSPLLLFSFFHWLYLFSSFVHPFPFYQNVPLRFHSRPEIVGGDRSVCVLLCNLCYLYSLVKMDCGVLFYLVSFCMFLQCFDTVGWVI